MTETSNALMRKTQLLTCEVTDKAILAAITAVPREKFVPDALRGSAYVDEDLPLGQGRFMLEPLVFARLLELADIQPHEHVLDIGCGLGYSAAVISKLARRVTAVESLQDLSQSARKRFADQGFENIDVIAAPLAQGCPHHQPYDVIFIEGAVQHIPDGVLAQLAVGGRVIAVEAMDIRPGSRTVLGALVIIEKIEEAWVSHHSQHLAAALLPGFEKAHTFRF